MNYRHLYHAGNFADVFKHILLVSLIDALCRKPQPLSYIETHAGIGNYDLDLREAKATEEFTGGIVTLLATLESSRPAAVNRYVQQVLQWNSDRGCEHLRYYPGSPCLVRSLLRENDKMILAELHPEDVVLLKKHFWRDPQVAVHQMDGYLALKAFLPPKPNRGLVLIDPPFEKLDEFEQVVKHFSIALQRWRSATYAIWYPIKDSAVVKQFYCALQQQHLPETLCCEIHLPSKDKGLTACGMVVVNPPWQWKEYVDAVLPWLSQALAAPDAGFYRVAWLVSE